MQAGVVHTQCREELIWDQRGSTQPEESWHGLNCSEWTRMNFYFRLVLINDFLNKLWPFWNKGCGVSAVSAHLTNKHVVSNWRCDRSHSPRRDSHLHPPHLPSGSRPSPPPPGELTDAVMSPLTWMMLDVHTALHSFHFSPASGVWRGTSILGPVSVPYGR